MKREQIIGMTLILVLMFLLACAPKASPAPQVPAPVLAPVVPAPAAAPAQAAPAKPAWQAEWEKTVEAAGKEGMLTAITQHGPEVRRALGTAFKSRFGIASQWLGGIASELSVRIMAERRAGIFSTDVGLISFVVPYDALKPAGALESLDKVLFLPELTDPQEIHKVWRFGELQWVDKDHTILVVTPCVEPSIAINTQLVKPGEIKSYRDLLNPKWKGKIIMSDPTLGSGPGYIWAETVGAEIMGWDYLRQLVEQEPVLTRDRRLPTEWVARGKYAIGIGTIGDVVKEFMDMGVPLHRFVMEEGSYLSAGGGAITLLRDAPHPNAAKLFINWFLSKEGQTVYRTPSPNPSGRLDVSTEGVDPAIIADPNMRYSKSYSEKAMQQRPEAQKMVKEVFGKIGK